VGKRGSSERPSFTCWRAVALRRTLSSRSRRPRTVGFGLRTRACIGGEAVLPGALAALDPAISKQRLHQMFAGTTPLGSEHIAERSSRCPMMRGFSRFDQDGSERDSGDRLDPSAGPRWGARQGRAQAAALPAVARRRAARGNSTEQSPGHGHDHRCPHTEQPSVRGAAEPPAPARPRPRTPPSPSLTAAHEHPGHPTRLLHVPG
jgi:hypothetical protein